MLYFRLALAAITMFLLPLFLTLLLDLNSSQLLVLWFFFLLNDTLFVVGTALGIKALKVSYK